MKSLNQAVLISVFTLLALAVSCPACLAEDSAIIFVASAPAYSREASEHTNFVKYDSDSSTSRVIATMFRRSGFTRIITLTGKDATRQNLENAFRTCAAITKKGERFALYLLAHGGEFEALLNPLDKRADWFCEGGDLAMSDYKQFEQLVEGVTNKVIKEAGGTPENWTKEQKDYAVKRLFDMLYGDATNTAILRRYLNKHVTDSNLRDWMERIQTDRCTALLESCYSGSAMPGFERGIDAGNGTHDSLIGRKFSFSSWISVRARHGGLAEILGSGARAIHREVVVVASVQNNQPARAGLFKSDECAKLTLGEDWIGPEGALLGYFTFSLLRAWQQVGFQPVKWADLLPAIQSRLSDLTKDPSGKRPAQEPQIASRHLSTAVLHCAAAPAAPMPNVPASGIQENYLNLHNVDNGILRVDVDPDLRKIKVGTSIKFTVDLGASGFLFLVNLDAQGGMILLPWTARFVDGKLVTPTSVSDLLEQARCNVGKTQIVGQGAYRLSALSPGCERVKALLFTSQDAADDFARAWLTANPKRGTDAARVRSRTFVIQQLTIASVYTADLSFEVTQ